MIQLASEKFAGCVRRNQPVFVLLGVTLGALGARWAAQAGVPMPFCVLRKLTGIPCPTCGCTRSLIAWTQFDLFAALRFNPLFFAVSIALIIWIVAWMGEKALGRPWFARFEPRWERATFIRILVSLVIINWLYLCLTLPK